MKRQANKLDMSEFKLFELIGGGIVRNSSEVAFFLYKIEESLLDNDIEAANFYKQALFDFGESIVKEAKEILNEEEGL